MLPDLGNYAIPVLSAYIAMLVLILGIVAISLRSAKKSRETLARLEEKRKTK